jgi:MarR family transcriptional regulator, lower aerobic nicotinate degradation pathway regulator
MGERYALYHKRFASRTMTDLPRVHPAVSGYTGFLMRKVSQASFEGFAAILGRHGLHPMHLGLLSILDAEGPISQQSLGRVMGVDPSTMVARMDALESRRLIERRRSDEDRRAYEISLTPKGRKTLERLRAEAEDWGGHFFRALTPKEQKQLNALLLKLATTVDEDAS